MGKTRHFDFGCKSYLTAAAICISVCIPRALTAQEVWFAPPDNLPRGTKVFNEDFPELWNSDKEWISTASHIAVFVMNPYYAAAAPEDMIRQISAFLSKHGIALAVGMQSLPVQDCGKGVEGMTRAGTPAVIARRLKGMGVEVKYFALDEPLQFGHIYKGAQACNYSVQEVASRLAGTIHELRSVYPDAKIIESEVPTGLPSPHWETTLNAWLENYEATTGTHLDALAMDLYFRKPWLEAARRTTQILHQHGTKVGIFLDAPGGPTVTDASWMTEAKQNIQAVQAAQLPLDFVIVASWMLHPWNNVPESDPLTLTSLVAWYLRNQAPKQ